MSGRRSCAETTHARISPFRPRLDKSGRSDSCGGLDFAPNRPNSPTNLGPSWKGRSGLASIEPDLAHDFLSEFLARESERLGLRLALIGGEGVNFWALPRFTEDFDLTVASQPDAIWALVTALKGQGYEVVRGQEASSASGPAFVRLVHGEGLPSVDLIAAKTEYQELLIERATPGGDGVLPVATPEDLIVLKLIASRSLDHRDIFNLIEAQPIDWPYVEHWAAIWHVSEELGKLRYEITHRE